MGAAVELRVIRAGYVPRGGGVVELRVHPLRRSLAPLVLDEQGVVRAAAGIAIASHLDERRVSERMAAVCEAQLAAAGITSRIERVLDTLASHPGASLAVWAHTSTGSILGADRAGAVHRSAESIGRFVAKGLLADLATGATTDRHAGDQLILFGALACGRTRYVVPAVTAHVETNLWLAEQFGARVQREGRRVEIDGIGLSGGDAD
jgi:RNA 3'-terminal phosphate cyclase